MKIWSLLKNRVFMCIDPDPMLARHFTHPGVTFVPGGLKASALGIGSPGSRDGACRCYAHSFQQGPAASYIH